MCETYRECVGQFRWREEYFCWSMLTVYHMASTLGMKIKGLEGIEYPVTHLKKA